MSKKTKRTTRVWLSVSISLLLLAAIMWMLVGSHSLDVLAPAGSIARQQRDLIIWTSLLSLVVVIPVFALTFFIVWRYRASNKKATYSPAMHDNKLAETIWWLIPGGLIMVLAAVTWVTSHSLDPYKSIQSDQAPLTVQVVALNWKWLFLYPDAGIASVNYVRLPVHRPVRFEITSDAPMNSFWIPRLGGQIYAMAGMQSELNLLPTKLGNYRGSSANLSGEGFAGMAFTAQVTSADDFTEWIDDVRSSESAELTSAVYAKLSQPSQHNPVVAYSTYQPGLYTTILDKYMKPNTSANPADKDHDAASQGQNTRHDAGNPMDDMNGMSMEHMHH